MKGVQVGLDNIFKWKQMMLSTLSGHVYSVRSIDVACCCELGTVLASINNARL